MENIHFKSGILKGMMNYYDERNADKHRQNKFTILNKDDLHGESAVPILTFIGSCVAHKEGFYFSRELISISDVDRPMMQGSIQRLVDLLPHINHIKHKVKVMNGMIGAFLFY
jgi:hypothetical protein